MTHSTADHQAMLTQAQKILRNILKSIISLYILLGIEKLSFMCRPPAELNTCITPTISVMTSVPVGLITIVEIIHILQPTHWMALHTYGWGSFIHCEWNVSTFYVTIAHSYVIMMLTFTQSWNHTWELQLPKRLVASGTLLVFHSWLHYEYEICG